MRLIYYGTIFNGMSGIIWIIETTTDQEEQANNLATNAVATGLVACAQVSGPVTSHYIWQGKTERAPEHRIHFKLSTHSRNKFVAWLLEKHPYDCPQILAWKAESDNPEYTDWINGK